MTVLRILGWRVSRQQELCLNNLCLHSLHFTTISAPIYPAVGIMTTLSECSVQFPVVFSGKTGLSLFREWKEGSTDTAEQSVCDNSCTVKGSGRGLFGGIWAAEVDLFLFFFSQPIRTWGRKWTTLSQPSWTSKNGTQPWTRTSCGMGWGRVWSSKWDLIIT